MNNGVQHGIARKPATVAIPEPLGTSKEKFELKLWEKI